MWEKYKPKTKRQREVIDLDAMEEEIAGKMPAQSFCPPEPIQQEPVSQSANQTETFKVVATLSTEYMSEIVGSFNWHGVPCLRVQLKNGDVVNMQEEDVRKEHPEMLIDYYEANNIKFWLIV